MIRYGIVIPLEDIFEIEAKKAKMDTKEFMLKILKEQVEDKEERKKAVKEFKNNPLSALWGYGIIDDLRHIFFDPLTTNPLEDPRGDVIFIGRRESFEDGILIPFSLIDNSIPRNERDKIDQILMDKGYGEYPPSLWFVLSSEEHQLSTTYTQKPTESERLP